MAWIRLDDDYLYHPKFVALSHVAFRLWHEGMAYCRKLLTDGQIPQSALKTFRYARPSAVTELSTPLSKGAAPLWEPGSDGFIVHDYLIWNKSRAVELQERDDAKIRAHEWRTNNIRNAERMPYVRRGIGRGSTDLSEKESEGKPDPPPVEAPSPRQKTVTTAGEAVEMRAGRLVELYGELYIKHRHGARYRPRPNLDWHDAIELCQIWDDARLEKLAVIVLTTDDDWIVKTDRSFHIFALKASWADDRLKAWELEHGVEV